MRRKSVFISIVFLVGVLHSPVAQSLIEPVELDSLYIRALELRVDLLNSSGYKYFEINDNTKRIKDHSLSPNFKFISTYELAQLNGKKNRGIDFYRMDHKLISTDTIEVSFYILTVFVKDEGFLCIVKGGGMIGYHTDIRFARKDDLTWEVIYNRFSS